MIKKFDEFINEHKNIDDDIILERNEEETDEFELNANDAREDLERLYKEIADHPERNTKQKRDYIKKVEWILQMNLDRKEITSEMMRKEPWKKE